MKKVLAICLALVLVMSMYITAFAAPGSFVSSPSGNSAPGVSSSECLDEECESRIVSTSYADRDQLSEEDRLFLEEAYNDIVNSDDLTELNADLAALAKEMGIDGEDLAVSDLFNLGVSGCDHEDAHAYEIVLTPDTLENFVGVMYKDENGSWVLVDDVEVLNGGNMKITTDATGPFVIIVNTGKSVDTPQTGDNFNIYLYGIIMAVSAIAIVVLLVKSKKQRA